MHKDELHELRVEVHGFDEPLQLHAGFYGYDDPYQALAKFGFFKGERRGQIVIGGAHLAIRFVTEPERRDGG